MAQPSMKFTEKSHKFGEIPAKGGSVRHTFRFVNGGDAPLVVSNAEVSCVCTSVAFSPKPVMPGEEGEITVTFDPKGREGSFYRAIKIWNNTPMGADVVIVSGMVVPGKGK